MRKGILPPSAARVQTNPTARPYVHVTSATRQQQVNQQASEEDATRDAPLSACRGRLPPPVRAAAAPAGRHLHLQVLPWDIKHQ